MGKTIKEYAEYGIIALVNHIKDNEHSDSLTMTYGEFANKINNLGKGNKSSPFYHASRILDEIWDLWSKFHEKNHDSSKPPYITILFVSSKSKFPSKGYGNIDNDFNRLNKQDKREKMKEQTKLIKEYLRSGKLDKFLLETVRADYRDSVPIQEDNNSKIADGVTLKKHCDFEYKLRNYSIVQKKKEKSGYICECCRFSFCKTYGKKYIECHHIKPLAKFGKNGEIIELKDLAALCANCHRMIHRLLIDDNEKYEKNYPSSMDDLKKLIKEQRQSHDICL